MDGAGNVADAYLRSHGGPPSWQYEAWNDDYASHAPVGRFPANDFGLHDVIGNVYEWCMDGYGPYDEPWRRGDGLREYAGAKEKVHRGGGWAGAAVIARSAARGQTPADTRNFMLGCRPTRVLSR